MNTAPQNLHRFRVTNAAQKLLPGRLPHEFQYQVCEALLAGRSVMLVAPTGIGKSLCYQIATEVNQCSTLIVTPLIALMDDQAKASAQLGFDVGRLHSGVDQACQWSAVSRWMSGEPQILYTSPERLQSQSLARCLETKPPGLIVVDEAHCVSTWGRKFRPAYRRLADLIQRFPKTPVLAMSATAGAEVQHDIAQTLQLGNVLTVAVPLDFPNTQLTAVHASTAAERSEILADLITDRDNLPMVVFCVLRKHCEAIANELRRLGRPALAYHAGMSTTERRIVHEAFHGDTQSILVATSAYEMGINNRNIRTIVHYGLPVSVESYVQGVGRAGRDGRPARALLLYADTDLDILDSMEALSLRGATTTEIEPLNLAGNEVYAYGLSKLCRLTFLRRHFHPDSSLSSASCERCDNCLKRPKLREATNHLVVAQHLKKWRKVTAARLGKPCFAILTNREITRLALHHPNDETELLHITGIRGPIIQRSQAEILAVIAEVSLRLKVTAPPSARAANGRGLRIQYRGDCDGPSPQ